MKKTQTTESRAGFRFDSLAQLCEELGAKRKIERVLVANNGLAAVKGIDSIRSWLYEHVGDPDAAQFVVMATPEDLKANAEFISMADQHVPVPGGPNGNNYANVDLIMHTAVQNSCDAIYPGWGHASENPALPRECSKSGRVVFLGPSDEAMFALGDKIASTIVAQSNGVPVVPWSGDSIRLTPGKFDIDPTVYDKAYVTSPAECVNVCQRIGFPVMIKASEGGGGKGIRRCTCIEDVKDLFFAVSEEVKGCHIFVMRMLENVRHLEVQLLADEYGDCIAVRTRDCSVQRRHQKIIEEGPAFGVSQEVIAKMEAAAIQLAKAVKYKGLGTVEYMYDKDSHDFFFLELNPRIQVEHPVSELISGVNLPAALYAVGMGIPLYRIPEVRAFYGEDFYGTTPIDLVNKVSLPPKNHTIAVRITAEDTDEGFRPTSGKVEEISFKNSKECWGYFSVGSGGEIHQFADSQFGHIFSSGETREEARRGMVLALRNLVIRGEIRTSTSYVLELLETDAFRNCDVSTAWLDRLIALRAAEAPKQQSVHTSLIGAAVFRLLRSQNQNQLKYKSFIAAGHVPSDEFLSNFMTESYVCRSEKFTVSVGLVSPNECALSLNGSIATIPFRILKSGAIQLTVGDKTTVAYVVEEPNNLRITIGGKATNFTGDLDPTKIFAAVPGRLVRYVIENNGHVKEGGTFAEVEVMKMILPLRASTSGVLQHRFNAGSTIIVGTLLAEIIPDDPSKVSRPREVTEPWPEEFRVHNRFERPDGTTRARRAVETLWNMLCGYHFKEDSLEERTRHAFQDIASLKTSTATLKSLMLPFIPETVAEEARSPNAKVGTVLKTIIERYLLTERAFDDKSRQDALEVLKEKHAEDADAIFAEEFAHNQESHHYVVKAICSYLEEDNPLLKFLTNTLQEVVTLHSYQYGSLLLQVRYLLRRCLLPSITERKLSFAKLMEEGNLEQLVGGSYGNDILCSILFDREMAHLSQVCIELFIRREYLGESIINNFDIFRSHNAWLSTFSCDPIVASDGPVSPKIRSGSGICMVFSDQHELSSQLAPSFGEIVSHASPDTCFAYVFTSVSRELSQEGASQLCKRALDESAGSVALLAKLTSIYFVVHGMTDGPHVFTFRSGEHNEGNPGFNEDTLLRNVLPQSARRLELDRLSNYNVAMFPSPFKDVHVFKATPKKPSSTLLENRIFARVALTPYDMGMEPWTEGTEVDAGHMVSKCMAALEFVRDDTKTKYPPSNHIFIKMIELTFDISTLQELLGAAASSYQQKLIDLGVNELELSFQVKVADGLIPMRVVAFSPSGYGLTVHVFYETVEDGVVFLHRAETSEDIAVSLNSRSSDYLVDLNPTSPLTGSSASPEVARTLSKLEALREMLPSKQGKATTLSSDEDRRAQSWVSKSVELGPHPLLNTTQIKRLQARAAGTTYYDDWPHILQLIIRKDWGTLRRSRRLDKHTIPRDSFSATRLYLSNDGESLTAEEAGSSPCAMVAWIIEYAPPSYYNLENKSASKRRFIMVANDITFQSGSFAVPEDVVFKAASVLARSEHVPFVYISANSGARLGLVEEVRKRFLVRFNSKGEIEYLYLKKDDVESLRAKGIYVEVEETPSGDATEPHFVIKGIVGCPTEFIGVENLKGSGLVAGEMSKNYSEIPTISIVSGRSVGIGAYLNRLGRRVIQTNDSPLILTGAAALNRLLGKDVYVSNSQLGGRQVMVPNGVTHWCTKHDYGSARQLLNWLDFVPAVIRGCRCSPQQLTLASVDPIDRDVTFVPEPNTPYDPRFLAAGSADRTGLFDRGSWCECLEGWAKSVVTGRATLGGIPCGVILVETRLAKKFNPADPADPTSSSSFIAQAGQVWFPDSARKTADALDDFHHERLPCFILANWRGFSGGMRDMFDEVLKFGASIVDNLRVYTSPVFIYIPPFGELRGGAWVVVDPVINHQRVVEMYCDETSRGGILEPSGVVEIKFRDKDVRELIRRSHPELAKLDAKKAREEEDRMLPKYRDVAVRFADLHDNHVRMKAVGVVRDVVPWKNSRRVFYHKLQRKLKELEVANDLVDAGRVANIAAGVEYVEKRYKEENPNAAPYGCDDEAVLAWLNQASSSSLFLAKTDQADPKSGGGRSKAERVEELRRLLQECKLGGEPLSECFAELFEDTDFADAARGALGNC